MNRLDRNALVFAGSCVALAFSGTMTSAQTAAGTVLAPHRAVYELKLARTANNSSLANVRGRILYEFGGNACDGYDLQFRQVSELNNGEGRSTLSDLRTTTWEDGAGKSYRFKSQNFMDQKQTDEVDGSAERAADGVTVTLKQPTPSKRTIDAKVQFPTQHIFRIIAAAREGATILELPVFDGSDKGQKVYQTLSVIGKEIPPGERVPDDAAAGKTELAGLKRWPVTVSYFDKQGTGGEQIPVYAISFELYENGISRNLLLDYNDFALKGDMTSLDIRPVKPCQP